MNQLDREKTEFVTDVALGAWMAVFPGQAKTFENDPVARTYSVELGMDASGVEPNTSLVQALSYVAQAYDPQAWKRHVFGTAGKIKMLHETRRDIAKYPYYQGKYIVSINLKVSPKSVGMENVNLADPAQRQRYEQAVNSRAPGVWAFAKTLGAAAVPRIEALNEERRLRGETPYREADYDRALIPLSPHEVWPGCFVRVSGRAYWSPKNANKLNLALSKVLFVRTGPRLVAGESSPDQDFGEFAPSEELAPAGNLFSGVI